jgi:hypothetical protein
VKTFEEAIGLRMKGCGGDVGHIEEGGKVGPEGRNKLRTAIRGDGVRKAKAGNPGGTKGIGTGTG